MSVETPGSDFKADVCKRSAVYFEQRDLERRRVSLDGFTKQALELAERRSAQLVPAWEQLKTRREELDELPPAPSGRPNPRYFFEGWLRRLVGFGVPWVIGMIFFVAYSATGSLASWALAMTIWLLALVVSLVPQFLTFLWDRRNRVIVERRFKAEGKLALAEESFDEAMDAAVLAVAEQVSIPPDWRNPGTDVVEFRDGRALSSKIRSEQYVRTPALAQLRLALTRAGGSTLGLAGSRGVGKSELAQQLTRSRATADASSLGPKEGDEEDEEDEEDEKENDGEEEAAAVHTGESRAGRLTVTMWAPVKYDMRTFLLGLLKRLCDEIVGSTYERSIRAGDRRRRYPWSSPLAFLIGVGLVVVGVAYVVGAGTGWDIRESRALLGSVLMFSGIVLVLLACIGPPLLFEPEGRFTPQELDQFDPSTLGDAMFVRQRIEYTEKTVSGVETGADVTVVNASVSESKESTPAPLTELDLVEQFRALVRSLDRHGTEVLIVIDELDKIDPVDDADRLLSDLKVLFPEVGCSFLISLSDQAAARFSARGIPLRDVFDSSFDEVIRVERLRFTQTRQLLYSRDAEISFTQALVVHALSGGLPREVLRAARTLTRAASHSDSRTLRESFAEVLCEEIAESSRAVALLRTANRDHVAEGAGALDLGPWSTRDDARDAVLVHGARIREERPQVDDTEAGLIASAAVLLTIAESLDEGGVIEIAGKEPAATHCHLVKAFETLADAKDAIPYGADGALSLVEQARKEAGMEELTASLPTSDTLPLRLGGAVRRTWHLAIRSTRCGSWATTRRWRRTTTAG